MKAVTVGNLTYRSRAVAVRELLRNTDLRDSDIAKKIGVSAPMVHQEKMRMYHEWPDETVETPAEETPAAS